jgi:hypothetical protein
LRCFFISFRIPGIDDLIRAEPQGILNFVRRVGEDHDMRAHCLGEFHAHVPKSAESHDADFLALDNFVVAQRGIGGDAGAEERGGGGEIQILRDVQHKGFIHDHALGISAVSHAAAVFIRAVEGKDRAFFAELFEVVLAAFTNAAGIHHATDAGDVAFLELLDARADFRDASDDFMAGHAGISGAMPFVADGMHVRVTDAAIENLDLHVVLAGITALKVEWRERRRGALGCVSIGFHNIDSFSVQVFRILSRRIVLLFGLEQFVPSIAGHLCGPGQQGGHVC